MDRLRVLFHYTIPPVDNRLHACSQRRLVKTPPLPSFSSDSTDSSAHNLVPLADGAQSGLDAFSRAAQEARDKSRRPNLSAAATYYRNALNLPKPSGKCGSMICQILWNWGTGFIVDFYINSLSLQTYNTAFY